MKKFAKISGPKTFFVIEKKFKSDCVGLLVMHLAPCRCDEAHNIIETETNYSIFTTQSQRVVHRFDASLKQQELYDYDLIF